MLIGFIWLNLMRAFTWGISFRDPLGNIELILISFCSIGLPISYNSSQSLKATAANSALPKSRADGSYSALGRYSASVSGGRVTFKFVFKF